VVDVLGIIVLENLEDAAENKLSSLMESYRFVCRLSASIKPRVEMTKCVKLTTCFTRRWTSRTLHHFSKLPNKSEVNQLTFVFRFLQASHATRVLEPRRRVLDDDDVGAQEASVEKDGDTSECCEGVEGMLMSSLGSGLV